MGVKEGVEGVESGIPVAEEPEKDITEKAGGEESLASSSGEADGSGSADPVGESGITAIGSGKLRTEGKPVADAGGVKGRATKGADSADSKESPDWVSAGIGGPSDSVMSAAGIGAASAVIGFSGAD
ncbi:MAG: hypothetical protein LBD29_02305 [Treponema sp.]|nr:hypothetical protein [Treponema sp.]